MVPNLKFSKFRERLREDIYVGHDSKRSHTGTFTKHVCVFLRAYINW